MKIPRKHLIIAAFAALAAGCVSCHNPPLDRRVTISPNLGTAVWVTDIRLAKGVSSHYTLQANVVNNTSSDLAVQWKVSWLDPNGVAIDSAMSGWSDRMLMPYEVVPLKGTAPTSNAVDMMFYVRRARQ